jgi:hypothetical protein
MGHKTYSANSSAWQQDFSPATPSPAAPSRRLNFGCYLFSFPIYWQTDDLCRFHSEELPKNRLLLLGEHFFKLSTPYTCPLCGTTTYWARCRPKNATIVDYQHTAESTEEFCQTIMWLARQLGMVRP